jgi:HEPN domain-containing protein
MGNTFFAGDFYAQSCFVCRQAGEKALKAYCLFKEYDTVRTHSLYQIIRTHSPEERLTK